MSEQITDAQLDEWQGLADAATDGPWEVPNEGWAVLASGPDAVIFAYSAHDECAECGEPCVPEPEVLIDAEDMALIAAARTIVPALIAEVRALRAQLDAAERQIAARTGETAAERLFKARAETAEARLEAVRKLHTDYGESQGYLDGGGYGYIEHCCGTCGSFGEYGNPWPCPTIRALDGEA